MAEKTPLLNLDTFLDRSCLKIDGALYELRDPGELSIIDFHRIQTRGARAQVLMDKEGDLSDAEAAELKELLETLCRVVLIAPEQVLEKLTDTHRLSVLSVFTTLQRGAMPPVLAPGAEAEVVAAEDERTGES